MAARSTPESGGARGCSPEPSIPVSLPSRLSTNACRSISSSPVIPDCGSSWSSLEPSLGERDCGLCTLNSFASGRRCLFQPLYECGMTPAASSGLAAGAAGLVEPTSQLTSAVFSTSPYPGARAPPPPKRAKRVDALPREPHSVVNPPSCYKAYVLERGCSQTPRAGHTNHRRKRAARGQVASREPKKCATGEPGGCARPPASVS